MQSASRRSKTKLKDQSRNLKIFLNFDLGFGLYILRLALAYRLLPITHYELRATCLLIFLYFMPDT